MGWCVTNMFVNISILSFKVLPHISDFRFNSADGLLGTTAIIGHLSVHVRDRKFDSKGFIDRRPTT